MDKKSAQKKAEIIEITPEILEEEVESIKKKKAPRSLETELMGRLSFAWLSCVTGMWMAFSLIELGWRLANVVFGLFKQPDSNKRFIHSLKALRLPFGLCTGSLLGVLWPDLGAKIARRIDKGAASFKSPAYIIIRMMFAKYL